VLGLTAIRHGFELYECLLVINAIIDGNRQVSLLEANHVVQQSRRHDSAATAAVASHTNYSK